MASGSSQVAFALDAAHDRGIVHRDVKPANVLIAGEGGATQAYLSDFGIAKELMAEPLTLTGQVVGTLDYMAPEVFRGEGADHRVDIYALGCVLHQVLTGDVPFVRDNAAAKIAAHLHEAIPSARSTVPAVSCELDAVLRGALAKRPEERPQRAGAFGASLIGALGGAPAEMRLSVSAPPAGAAGSLSARPARTNLRATPGAMIGRRHDLDELIELCRNAEEPIVTVTGPGGVGKTRLAVVAAHRLLEDFPDGVFIAELEHVPEASGVPVAITRALELLDAPGVAPMRRLADHLDGRRVLLVLDNFEHVPEAAQDLVELVNTAPGTRVLVTSQAPLHVEAERVFPLRPLALPDGSEADLAALAEVPALALLLQRARRTDPEIAITPDNAEALTTLCTQLDGLPLGLELAASRLALLSPAQLVERLNLGLDALGHGGPDRPARHGGLRATMDWTISQLAPDQITLLSRLAMFVGGFSLPLAEAVGNGDVIENLAVLRDRSLVRRDPTGRLWMPPPVRTFALELIREPEATRSAHARHAEAVLQLIETLSLRWLTDLVRAMMLVAEEAGNLREALRWTRDAEPEWHARLVGAAAWWFRFSGQIAEAVPELDAAIAVTTDPTLRARLFMWRNYWGTFSPEDANAAPDTSRAEVEATRQLANTGELVVGLYGRSLGHGLRGEGELALEHAREAERLARELGDQTYQELAALAVGDALEVTGDSTGALQVLEALVASARPGGWVAVMGASYLADARLAAGDARKALAGYCGWLRDMQNVVSPPNEAFQLDGAAMALAALDRSEEAMMAAALADRLRHEHSFTVAADFLATRNAALTTAREALGAAGCEQCEAWAAASSLAMGIASIAALA